MFDQVFEDLSLLERLVKAEDGAYEQMVDAWYQARVAHRSTVMLAARRTDVDALNLVARERMVEPAGLPRDGDPDAEKRVVRIDRSLAPDLLHVIRPAADNDALFEQRLVGLKVS